jgi:mRNA-degrading endonuclease RelE of RelBE toxin-antitoxin system
VANYRIELKKSAAKEIEKLNNKAVRKRIVARIQKLAEDPHTPGCEKPSGSEHYRVGKANTGSYFLFSTISWLSKS